MNELYNYIALWIIKSLLKRHWLQWDLNCEPPTYSKVCNRWEKLKILIAREGRGWLLINCFFLSISNHKNYSIKNICVSIKSKENWEHVKLIYRRLFTHKYCNNSKKCCYHPPGQYLLERLCFRLHLTLLDLAGSGVFTKRQLFLIWVRMFFDSFLFSTHE